MFIDARTLPPDAVLNADLCIVGAGPAGIALALSFAGLLWRVIVLEAGGETATDGGPELVAGGAYGGHAPPTALAGFGGNAQAWCVQTPSAWRNLRLMPMPPEDFEARLASERPAWPLSAADLAPYYAGAQAIFGLPPGAYRAADWSRPSAAPWPDTPSLETGLFQFGAADKILVAHRDTLRQATNVVVLTHAEAVRLDTSENGLRIERVRAASAPDRPFTVWADTVVLAAGGLGSTRLLLDSDAHHPGGIGDASGHLGRWLMDHPLIDGGDLVPPTRDLFPRAAFYDLRLVDGTPVMGHFRLPAEVLRRTGLPSLSTILLPRASGYRKAAPSPRQAMGIQAAIRLRDDMRARRRPRVRDVVGLLGGVDGVVAQAVRSVLSPAPNLAHGGWSERRRQVFDTFQLVHQAEQWPHADNRVRLATQRDRFGRRPLVIDWRLHEADRTGLRAAQSHVAKALGAAGFGTVLPIPERQETDVIAFSTGHHMGTTRMSAAPRDGVVDPDLRVHGVENLHVCSSSVFPSGGYANPTLTIVALALRLADTLKARRGR